MIICKLNRNNRIRWLMADSTVVNLQANRLSNYAKMTEKLFV